MGPNTKYQPAPQRDSFDEPSYSQAPPSYQAEASDPMLGAPRGEDDNVPDDFKVSSARLYSVSALVLFLTLMQFGGSVAEATLPIRMQFVRKVYAILYVTLSPNLNQSCD